MDDDLSHIFISYATEDWIFADWLARKLAIEGYAVWFDRIKLLGGESWPKSVEDALDRSSRMLALMSSSSIEKDLPLKERTKGLKIGRARKIQDFVIPLRLDNSEWDWTFGDTTPVPFEDRWAVGWCQLLKKLDQIGMRKALHDGASRAKTSLVPESALIREPESLRLNIIPCEITEKTLKCYTLPQMTEASLFILKKAWGFYQVNEKAIALTPPPHNLSKGITATPAKCFWPESELFVQISVRTLIVAIFKSSISARLLKSGFHIHPKKRNVFYLPAEQQGKNRLAYTDLEGRQRHLQIRRFKTFRRGGDKLKIFFHFAFRFDLAKGIGSGFHAQLLPTLMLFDEEGHPIMDERVNTMRRKITQGWYNEDWRDRYLAAEQLLLKTQDSSDDGIFLAELGITLNVPCKLNEAMFKKSSLEITEEVEDAGEIVEYEPLPPTSLNED